jgi:endonuclease/exonuclease/phosphatase family metal-dependent hydrolase
MKGLQKVFWFFYKCLAFYTLLVFALVYWTPSSNWFLGFLMMSFPIALALNVLSIAFWLIVKPAKAVYPVIICLLSLAFLSRTFSFGKSGARNADNERNSFKVMSYNVSSFNTPMKDFDRSEAAKKMKAWITDSNADILCLPEYISRDGSEYNNMNGYFSEKGYQYRRLYVTDQFKDSDYYGMALLSKYPIVYARDTIFAARNGLILADVKMGKDTVRVISVHLYSMTLKLYTLVGQKELSGIERESRNTFSLLKTGFKKRSEELETLKAWIESSPHPVVVCGDFNETPYSYVYGRTRKLLTNAFEEKGSGFGFTYNHLPYFIRIDHHFYDKERLTLTDFVTDRSVRFSDHYPLMGVYAFK